MIFCPSCGAVNAENRDTCEQCGSSMAMVTTIVCEACGTKNPSVHRFCMRCGRLIVRPELSARAPATEEPSRPVSQQPRTVPITALILAIFILGLLVLVLLWLQLR